MKLLIALLFPSIALAEGYYYPVPANPQPLQYVLPPAYVVPPQQVYVPPPVYIAPIQGTPPSFERFDTGRVYSPRDYR
jgi:hypothetical protein